MNKLLILGAAAALAFSAAPAFADDRGRHNDGPDIPCLSSLTAPQTQCAVNFVAKPHHRHSSNDWNSQFIKQKQGGEVKGDVEGNVQLQLGLNVVLKGDGNDQTIKQRQWLEAKGDVEGCGGGHHGNNNDRGRGRGRGDDCGPTQVQAGANIVVHGDHNDQAIYQSQSYDNNNHRDETEGTQQAQGALNIVMGGDNNSQTIVQSQSLEVGSSHHGGGHNPS